MALRHSLRTWQRLDWRRRRLLLEAVMTLPLAGVILRLVPFKHVAAWLGNPGRETQSELGERETRIGTEIGWAVRAAALRLPGRPKCLAQGLAAAAMARHHRVPVTLYLGVARQDGNGLEAHAWVRCGGQVVTGRVGHRRFQVVERFARE